MHHPRLTRRVAADDDQGFTLIEVIVAMFITLVVMTALLYLVVSSIGTIAQAKQRQTATSLATQALERLRALPYDTVTQPDGSAPAAGLEYVVSSGGTLYFRPTALVPGFDQALVVNRPTSGWTGSGQIENLTVGAVRYKVSTYVTKAPVTGAGQQAFTATSVVSWSSAVTKGTTRRVVEQSVLYSPAGCLSTAQSPFAAPCQSYFTAQAGQVLSGVSVVNPDDSTQPIEGFGANKLELNLPSYAASLLIEQTASANADAQTAGATKVDGTTTTQGGVSAAASVDSDPSSTPGQSQTETTPGYSSGGLSDSGVAGRLVVQSASGNFGTASSAIAAPSTVCTGVSGTGLVTGAASMLRPCASSSLTAGTSPSSVVYQPAWGAGGDVTVVRVAGTSTPGRAVAAQLTASNTEACTAGSGPGVTGCGYGASARTLGETVLGASSGASSVPSGFGPGLVRVTGLTESARAEEGLGARAPAYTRSGTLEIWNGTGYSTVDLSTFAAPAVGATPAGQTWAIPATTIGYPAALGDVALTYEGSVTVQRPVIARKQTGATRTGTLATDCKTAACTTQVNGGGVVTSTLTVTVQRGGIQVGRFGVTTTLGGLVAQASYKVAANG